MSLDQPTDKDQQGEALSLEEQQLYDQDRNDLASSKDVPHLVGRLDYGIDPAAMMTLRDIKPIVETIAQKCGTTFQEVWLLIKRLHHSGPWQDSRELKEAKNPVHQVYIVLANACHEKDDQTTGLTPRQYLDDRIRVIQRLVSFTPDQVETRKEDVIRRVKNRSDVSVILDGQEVKIQCAEGDPALSLAMDGHQGCVTKGGPNYYAQTTEIPDTVLEEVGLKPGYAEVFDPETKAQKRVPVGTEGSRTVWVKREDAAAEKPMAKRIWPGYVLTFDNKELAAKLVARALQKKASV